MTTVFVLSSNQAFHFLKSKQNWVFVYGVLMPGSIDLLILIFFPALLSPAPKSAIVLDIISTLYDDDNIEKKCF